MSTHYEKESITLINHIIQHFLIYRKDSKIFITIELTKFYINDNYDKFLNDQYLREFTQNLNENLKLLCLGMWKISIEG
ncbi:hypothetical protein RhiirA1_484092 [Rhizophagus irregularis]|uniref:Uncharacterized protein n=1 Tax=Rhizophagus irregularis TaxID=588596 RepID=A0A2N0QJQ5_9GLOM|nr:hypothetical protein RhiirA1_484092 [Rhizophagus irregularis]